LTASVKNPFHPFLPDFLCGGTVGELDKDASNVGGNSGGVKNSDFTLDNEGCLIDLDDFLFDNTVATDADNVFTHASSHVDINSDVFPDGIRLVNLDNNVFLQDSSRIHPGSNVFNHRNSQLIGDSHISNHDSNQIIPEMCVVDYDDSRDSGSYNDFMQKITIINRD